MKIDTNALRPLRDCPFCGGSQADQTIVRSLCRVSDAYCLWSVECMNCGVQIADDESQEAADAHWNTRPLCDLIDAQRAEIAARIHREDMLRSTLIYLAETSDDEHVVRHARAALNGEAK